MTRVAVALLIYLAVHVCSAQDITAHVIEAQTHRPVKGAYLNLRTDCLNPKRPKAIQAETDQAGSAIFRSVILTENPICIDVFSVAFAYAPGTLDYIFSSGGEPQQRQSTNRPGNVVVTKLPADITFYVRKRSLGERLQFLFQGS